ncbi:MAG: flavin reductase family protein [Ruminococcaceae bacterium]|nr:flavin reductase family protein [Oscillospiraceae bacterium]
MKEIPVSMLNLNPYEKIAKEWMLCTAGGEGNYNTMTCSWGHLGSLWNQPTAICYVRPQRYTRQFIDREEKYTLCFFPAEYKRALGYLGTVSGRDEDKVASAGLTPVHEAGVTYFAEASLVLVCRTLYQAPLKEECFRDKAVMDKMYPEKDFHDLYIGAIEKVLVKE